MRVRLFIVFTLLLAGCTASIDPIYEQIPLLPAIPEVKTIPKRKIPPPIRETLSLTLPLENNHPTQDDYVNRKNAWVNFKTSHIPSVVIGIPDEVMQIKAKRENTQEALHENLFKTDGYFHIVEQITEKALLKKGFNVIDRSKFEAKLRDLRDKSSDPDYYSTQDRINKELIEVAKQRFNRGEISINQYHSELASIETRSGRKRAKDDKEMVDVSELIRAAQSEGIQADYILQINQASISKKGEKIFVRLKDFEDFNYYVNNNPEIEVSDSISNRSLPHTLEIPIFKTEYNAKLIHVKTGSIDWLGSHTLSSKSVEKYKIGFDISKAVTNEEDINRSIDNYNKRLLSAKRSIEITANELQGLYERGLIKRWFKTSKERDRYVDGLKEKIKKTEIVLKKEIERLNEMQLEIPAGANAQLHYKYSVQGPHIEPRYDSTTSKQNLQLDKAKQHRDELLKSTVRSLLQSIDMGG